MTTEKMNRDQEQEQQIQLTVPYIVYESSQARAERTQKRLIIALIVAIVLLFATNGLWLWHTSQYEVVGSEVTVDTEGEGNANYIGQDGDIYNGTNNGENSENQKNIGR